jgi:hypothetical protein
VAAAAAAALGRSDSNSKTPSISPGESSELVEQPCAAARALKGRSAGPASRSLL